MVIANGLLKTTSYKKQTALGTTASGSGGQKLRRVTSVFKADRDTFESNEIVSHHQSTGVAYGLKKSDGKVDGVLSSGTYSAFIGSILERDFAAVSAYAAGIDVTAAATAPQFVDASGGFLTAGLKVGMVGRWTGFAGGSAVDNNSKNFLITALTATNMTGVYLDGTAVVADAAGDSVTFTPVGKRTYAPETGHTKDYYTIEEWYSDLTRSELFGDQRVSSINVNLPATGNATVSVDFVGLSRTLGASQILTTPTAETTTAIMSAVNGKIYIGGTVQGVATSLQFTISNAAANAGAVIGSNSGADVTSGRIKVSGTFTAQFDSVTLSTLYDGETNTSISCVLAGDETATADFVSFTMPRVKITGDAPNDGETAIVRTYPFTAEIYTAGGAALAYDKTILAVEDSAA